ncbi:MAG TPA: Ku protein [Solirubrobacteraceae bacterium]|nr:Ku protein [Solirubrobacteraceae bacterium]
MPRAIWTGAISFGLVTVPVKLYSAVNRKTVRFHQLSSKTQSRVQQKRVDAETGEELEYQELLKGYELAPDRYVVISGEELDTLAPEKTKTIDIEDFVELEQIDPIYYDHPYYLSPGQGGAKPYSLLLAAMEETSKVAIARVVIRSKEQLVALRPVSGVLEMATMLFADEVLSPQMIEDMPDPAKLKASARELAIAKQLVESLASDFEPERYHDTYREQVLELVERKAQGEEIAIQAPAEAPREPAPDLMSALKASLEAVRAHDVDADVDADGDGAAKPRKAPAKQRTAAKAARSKAPPGKRAEGGGSGKRAGAKPRATAKR